MVAYNEVTLNVQIGFNANGQQQKDQVIYKLPHDFQFKRTQRLPIHIKEYKQIGMKLMIQNIKNKKMPQLHELDEIIVVPFISMFLSSLSPSRTTTHWYEIDAAKDHDLKDDESKLFKKK